MRATTRRINVLAMGLALAVSASAGHAAAAKQPNVAMWKLASGGTTIYLFGSIHVLPADTVWKNPVIEKAMAESDIFYFETVLGEGGSRKMQTVMNRDAMLPKGKKLSAMLSEKGKTDLKALSQELGLDMAGVDRLRPWAAMSLLSSAVGRDEAVVPGVDYQVGAVSLQNRKHRRYFAMPLDHGAILGRLDEGGPQVFEAALRDIRNTRRNFRQLVDGWLAGETDRVLGLGTSGLNAHPVTRRILLDERNEAWVKEVPQMLREKRTFFVTVGAAHLSGQGSVIDLLCRQGHAVQRIHTASNRTEQACPAKALHVAEGDKD
jgi:uncharacterized protein YbaP (TraB family)